MRHFLLRILGGVATLAAAAVLPAHGGQYRGPWNAPAAPAGPAGPAGPVTGGPGAAGPGAPLTGGRPGVGDGTSWQVWWEFNKDPLVEQLAVEAELPVTGSDEFYLGGTRKRFVRDAQKATEADRRDRIARALADALRGTSNKDLTTAAMIALAKVGLDPDRVSIRDLFAQRLADGDQEVRETAALALGIAGQKEAIDTLVALVRDTPAGRKLAGGEVPVRTRTFAAWGLGLLARASADVDVKQRVHDVLLAELADQDEKSRDLRIGLVNGLGLLTSDASGAAKMLTWRTAAELWDYYDRDLGKGDQVVQAHVPIAVARLLGRGTGSEHRRAKQRLVEELETTKARHHAIHQSAAMALGSLCLPPEQDAEDAEHCAALRRYYERGTDQLTRFFCVLSLGRIGGDSNREALLSLFQTSNRNIERPWIALALGLVARERARRDGTVDETIGRLLHAEFDDNASFDARSALALAVGLTGHAPAADSLVPCLELGSSNDMLVGYAALALALLDHHPAADRLVALLRDSKRRPFVLQQSAVALGRLGDVRVVPLLQQMLADSDSTAVLSGIATALALVGDRRSIDPLIAAMLDKERPFLAKAFAAVALGGIGDKDPLPWNTVIAAGMNYMAHVDTLTNGATGVLDIL